MKSSVLALLPALAAAKPVPDVGISTVNVVGGQEASATEFPFIVSLESKTEGEEGHYCGGTLLNSLTVLTAAHCLASEDAENVQIRAGHRVCSVLGFILTVQLFLCLDSCFPGPAWTNRSIPS